VAEIHHSICISASLGTVDALASTPEGFQQWWAEDVESQPDGSFSLGFFIGRRCIGCGSSKEARFVWSGIAKRARNGSTPT
jgi:hypothetical protein